MGGQGWFNILSKLTDCWRNSFPSGFRTEVPIFLLVIGWEFPQGFPSSSDGKESACNAGDTGSIPGLGRSPGEGNGNPLQYSCPKNPMERGAWWATVCGVSKSGTRLNSTFTFRSYRQFFASWPPQTVHNLNVFLSCRPPGLCLSACPFCDWWRKDSAFEALMWLGEAHLDNLSLN